MKKDNFFNFKEKNIWDIGWPCSPRRFSLILILVIGLIFSLVGCIPQPEATQYTIKVEVHYPTRIDTLSFTNTFTSYPKVSSYEGTNTIYAYNIDRGHYIDLIDTTAPINIIEVK